MPIRSTTPQSCSRVCTATNEGHGADSCRSGTALAYSVASAARLANGIPWLGHEVNESGHAALILGEGGFDLGERLSSWLHGSPGASDDRMLFSVEEGLDLMDQQEVDQIIDDLLEFADDWKIFCRTI